MTMTEKTINLFVCYYGQQYPFETIEFLMEQFETISECETNSVDEQVSLSCFIILIIKIKRLYFSFSKQIKSDMKSFKGRNGDSL
jgi:hypothetical protein